MKKLAIPAFTLLMSLSAGVSIAQEVPAKVVVQQNEKVEIKPDALPEAVKKTLSGDAYKGWNVTTAYEVKAAPTHYEVLVSDGKETKTLKFSAEGQAM